MKGKSLGIVQSLSLSILPAMRAPSAAVKGLSCSLTIPGQMQYHFLADSLVRARLSLSVVDALLLKQLELFMTNNLAARKPHQTGGRHAQEEQTASSYQGREQVGFSESHSFLIRFQAGMLLVVQPQHKLGSDYPCRCHSAPGINEARTKVSPPPTGAPPPNEMPPSHKCAAATTTTSTPTDMHICDVTFLFG